MKPLKLLVCFLVLALSVPLDAAQVRKATNPAKNPPEAGTLVEFDHLHDPDFVEYSLTLSHGQVFVISITNTLPARFTYEIEELERPERVDFSTKSGVEFKDLGTKRIPRVHDEKFAGYIVHISHDGPPIDVEMPDKTVLKLHNATIKIEVKTAEWDYEVSGAFTATGLRDPVFALEKKTVDNVEQQFVVRDKEAEDTEDLGLGALIHVFHSRFPWVAATFGLGVNDGNRTTYYAGPTLRLGNKAAFSVGVAAGSVARLPAGVSVGSRVTDANLLNNLGTRIDRSWFVGFSYTFLNPGSGVLKKPFAGETTTPGSSGDDSEDSGDKNDNKKNDGKKDDGKKDDRKKDGDKKDDCDPTVETCPPARG